MQYTKEQFQEILDKHRLWLEEKPGGERASLSGANLRWANLRWANLNRANLRRANLSGTDLSGANLSRAGLSEASLSGASLSGANLSGADLSDANLNGAILVGTDLSGANLSRANLSKADLSRADLSGANLKDTNIYILCSDFVEGTNLVVISTGLQHRIVKHGDILYIGCEKHNIAHWLEHYQKIGEDYRYSPEEIEIYGKCIKLLSEI